MPRSLSEAEIAAFREKLCETATRLFAEKGAEGVTMRELATALGVSAMTPYRYFRDKNEILAAIRARAFERFTDSVETAYAGKASLIERVCAKRDAYIRFALEHKDCYRLMFDLAQPESKDYPELDRASSRARDSMIRHADDLIQAGILQGDPERIALVLWAMMHGVVSLYLAGKLEPSAGIQPLIDDATQVLLRGFARQDDGPAADAAENGIK